MSRRRGVKPGRQTPGEHLGAIERRRRYQRALGIGNSINVRVTWASCCAAAARQMVPASNSVVNGVWRQTAVCSYRAWHQAYPGDAVPWFPASNGVAAPAPAGGGMRAQAYQPRRRRQAKITWEEWAWRRTSGWTVVNLNGHSAALTLVWRAWHQRRTCDNRRVGDRAGKTDVATARYRGRRTAPAMTTALGKS